jgi:ParB/RepB/Spo0J family partition protein
VATPRLPEVKRRFDTASLAARLGGDAGLASGLGGDTGLASGLGGNSATVRLPLAFVDAEDTRFQHRLVTSGRDLLQSLREQGQVTPILLTGAAAPFTILDGFRRVAALTELGSGSVLATFVEARDERERFARSFAANLQRRSLGPYDKANAVWQALHRFGMDKLEVAALLGLSVRQVDRYLQLLGFGEPLREALASGRIGMAHAVTLHRACAADPVPWIRTIEESGLSASELAKRLRPPRQRRAHAPSLVRDAKGFRLGAIRFRKDSSAREKRAIWDALESALRLIAESAPRG